MSKRRAVPVPRVDTVKEARAIILAEYKYWRDADEIDPGLIASSAGAMAACANVLAAIDGIVRADWHPEPAPAAIAAAKRPRVVSSSPKS